MDNADSEQNNKHNLPKTAIILPTYNERDNIGRLIPAILELDIPGKVVVVDDNSPDRTAEVAREYVDAHPDRVVLIQREAKLGLGTAYIAGFKEMLKDPTMSLFMTMDADFSHNPSFIPDLIRASGEADIVIGSRYVPGGKTQDFAWHRRLISRSANILAKTVLGLTPNDCTAGFRGYKREVLETIGLDRPFSKGYSFLVEMLFRCAQKGFKVKEVPITYVARAQGLSKISMEEIINTGKTIFKLRLQGGDMKCKPTKKNTNA